MVEILISDCFKYEIIYLKKYIYKFFTKIYFFLQKYEFFYKNMNFDQSSVFEFFFGISCIKKLNVIFYKKKSFTSMSENLLKFKK